MDREAWRAVIHGVAKSWTRLSDWTELMQRMKYIKTNRMAFCPSVTHDLMIIIVNSLGMLLSHVWLFANPWTVACRISLSMEFSRQEYWSRLPFPTPVDLPVPRTETASPELADGFSVSWEAKINSEFWIQKVWEEDSKKTWPLLRKEQQQKHGTCVSCPTKRWYSTM